LQSEEDTDARATTKRDAERAARANPAERMQIQLESLQKRIEMIEREKEKLGNEVERLKREKEKLDATEKLENKK